MHINLLICSTFHYTLTDILILNMNLKITNRLSVNYPIWQHVFSVCMSDRSTTLHLIMGISKTPIHIHSHTHQHARTHHATTHHTHTHHTPHIERERHTHRERPHTTHTTHTHTQRERETTHTHTPHTEERHHTHITHNRERTPHTHTPLVF